MEDLFGHVPRWDAFRVAVQVEDARCGQGVVNHVELRDGEKGAVMTMVGQPFTCGIWTVRDGSEDEFVARWTALVSSAVALPGSESFLLIQDRADPHRFISFGAWDEWATADRWRASEVFADAMRACRELCEDFRPNDSTLRVALGS